MYNTTLDYKGVKLGRRYNPMKKILATIGVVVTLTSVIASYGNMDGNQIASILGHDKLSGPIVQVDDEYFLSVERNYGRCVDPYLYPLSGILSEADIDFLEESNGIEELVVFDGEVQLLHSLGE